ncbi:hypothetical protein JVT61DRAFT_14855 [Boletus reticuloceps]|uniref:Uncharacterized protein n=1 Tax=Boletus reticuloceps TaxID=495285 RepID=A0A8I3A2X9_9AGAM|nr:hypothetical protein JVT61DRAFT_14855 [Boletus reticuloceps]
MATGATRRGCRCTVASTTVPQASPDVFNDPVIPAVPAGQPTPPELPVAPATIRTNRNCCAPVRYHDSAADSKFIDIGIVGESSSNNDIVADGTQAQPSGPGLPRAHAIPAARTTQNPARAAIGTTLAAVAVMATPNAATITNPLATTGRSKAPPTSADVHHFFKRSKPEDTVCRVCQ